MPAYGRLSRPQPRRADRRRPRRGRALQARPGRLRAVEAVDRRPARLGQPVGPRPPGLAHRVLGDERALPGRDLRHPRRRPRPDLPAPRERDRPELLRPRHRPMARYWMHNGFLDMRGEKMSKSLGNVVRVPEHWRWRRGRRSGCSCYALSSAGGLLGRRSDGCEASLDRAYRAINSAGMPHKIEPDPEVVEALLDDLNTPAAMARLHVLIGDVNRTSTTQEKIRAASILYNSAMLIGLLNNDDWFGREAADNERVPSTYPGT